MATKIYTLVKHAKKSLDFLFVDAECFITQPCQLNANFKLDYAFFNPNIIFNKEFSVSTITFSAVVVSVVS